MTIFKRKIYDRLLDWKRDSRGKTALLIEGPRRVGKSTIVKIFGQNEYESYIAIDFNEASSYIKDLFNDLTDLNYIFLALQSEYKVQLHERKSLIIFDEVQKCPRARQAIKYLVADGRYDYIETGSLISIKQNTKDITIPSEEEAVNMYPMDFEEFRWALGDDVTFKLLSEIWERQKSLDAAHRKLMRDFRLYMLVGGMPQAVLEYLETNNLSSVDKVKRRIIKLYEDDFLKIDPSGRISKLFKAIPGQLNRKSIRFSTAGVIGKQSELSVLELLKALEDSKTVNVVYRCDDPNVGMSLTSDINQFKIYLADTGLFVTLAFWDSDAVDNIIYSRLLSDKLAANLGYVYENVVAQLLISAGCRPFYYTWRYDEKHFYEIDFLIQRRLKICPIEVKSSTIISHKSLDAFMNKFSSRVDRAYLISPKEYRKDGNVTVLPPYYTSFLNKKTSDGD